MNKIFIIAALAAVSAAANAVIVETESNNTFATANAIALPVPNVEYADGGVLTLGGSHDVDFFKINLAANTVLSATAIPLENGLTTPDTELGLFDSAGTLLASSDDTAFGTASFALTPVTAAGIYYIGVTGSGDDSFTGAHSQTGKYQLNVAVSPVPEPASFAALGLGAVALIRRRKGANR